MGDSQKSDGESGRDTSPLDPEQLSSDEWAIIREIELRLEDAKKAEYRRPSSDADTWYPGGSHGQSTPEPYLACVESRYPRVLLLDGGRGTGKTSLLLTLVRMWHSTAGVREEGEATRGVEYSERVQRLRTDHGLNWAPPNYVRVVPILDFDPLPPGMPLVAGIMQAWRPLAEQYARPTKPLDDTCDDDNLTLMDLWHQLFRVAAVGWAAIPKQSGLIEQVLDRQEQVQDWLRLHRHWEDFVGKAIAHGQSMGGRDKLPKEAVFVIMIDDVDLQVKRIRELLPALRLHPRVFFLVAAHKVHMIDMLKLDFFGQQNELAYSAFEKVFARKNHWTLERLSIQQFLAFPGHAANLTLTLRKQRAKGSPARVADAAQQRQEPNFLSYLREIKRQLRSEARDEQDSDRREFPEAGALISEFAQQAEAFKLPGLMTYRAAAQLRQYVKDLDQPLQWFEVLAGMLSGNPEAQAIVVRHGAAEVVSSNKHRRPRRPLPMGGSSDTHLVDVPLTGELAALYRPGPVEPAGQYSFVLSARPDFIFIGPADQAPARMRTDPGRRFNFTAGLIAKTLEEAYFPVDSTGLRWETYLSLAWTEWLYPRRLSFAWTRHKHPRPDQLFRQTRSWAEFIKSESFTEPKRKVERYAYAWVHYQRQWSGYPADDAPDPTLLPASNAPLPWPRLLDFGKKITDEKRQVWERSTLPLLARPEVGFPPEVQGLLLRGALKAGVTVREELKRVRRRLVTDAFVAAEAQLGKVLRELPEEEEVEGIIKTIDEVYKERHSEPSLWSEIERVATPRIRKAQSSGSKG